MREKPYDIDTQDRCADELTTPWGDMLTVPYKDAWGSADDPAVLNIRSQGLYLNGHLLLPVVGYTLKEGAGPKDALSTITIEMDVRVE